MQDDRLLAEFTHQEVERLRDPSHWATLTPARLRVLGERAGLTLEHEELTPYALDFDRWLDRGSGGPGARALVERALTECPATAESLRVSERDGRRVLELRLWLARWRRQALPGLPRGALEGDVDALLVPVQGDRTQPSVGGRGWSREDLYARGRAG